MTLYSRNDGKSHYIHLTLTEDAVDYTNNTSTLGVLFQFETTNGNNWDQYTLDTAISKLYIYVTGGGGAAANNGNSSPTGITSNKVWAPNSTDADYPSSLQYKGLDSENKKSLSLLKNGAQQAKGKVQYVVKHNTDGTAEIDASAGFATNSTGSYLPSISYASMVANFALTSIGTTTFDYNYSGSPSATVFANSTGTIVTAPTPTRTGYTFNGWYSASSGGTLVVNGGASYTLTTIKTLYAQWSLANPVFSDQALSFSGTQPRMNIAISSTGNDLSVTASPVDSVNGFSISGGPSWLTGSQSGNTYTIGGTPKRQGTFTFSIIATNAGNTTTIGPFSITVMSPGKNSSSAISYSKRFIGIGQSTTDIDGNTINADSNGYVLLSRMKRWNGSSWVDISNTL